MSETLRAHAERAPTGPGVYFLLGPRGDLLYVGKAASLRRRLLDHARGGPGARAERLGPAVREVRWVECADEREALCREADVIVALAPPFNAVMAADAFTYVCVGETFRLRERPEGRSYGAFPHLGKGKHSWRAVRTNAGYSALLRLLWVANAPEGVRFRIPSRLHGTSPPVDHDARMERAPAALHDFLSGRGGRLLDDLRRAVDGDGVPAFMRRPLADDLEAAEEFYRLGPHALRRMRLRHGLPPGPVDKQTFARLVTDDLRAAIGHVL